MPCASLQRKSRKFQEEASDLEMQLLELGFLCEKDDGARQIAENYGFYAAHISRWVSTDPIWLEDGINLYAYVHGNPLSGVEPSGTQTDEYYLARKIDYELRHPGQKAPDYYEEYGNVYLHKFKYDTRESLSLKGKTWNDSALVKLQRPIESMIKITQGKIEENPDVFRAFAFEMHPDAYIKAGFYSLSIVDWAKIGLTPSFDHLFSEEGAQQIVTIIYKWLEN